MNEQENSCSERKSRERGGISISHIGINISIDSTNICSYNEITRE